MVKTKKVQLHYTTRGGKVRLGFTEMGIPPSAINEVHRQVIEACNGVKGTSRIVVSDDGARVGALVSPQARANFDRIFRKRGK